MLMDKFSVDPKWGMTPMTLNKTSERLRRWAQNFPEIVKGQLEAEGQKVNYNIRYHYLSGQVLGVKTGRLRKSITHKTYVTGKDVRLRMSEHGVSPKGFPYGAYWMSRGRDFMKKPMQEGMGRLVDRLGRVLVDAL